MNKKVVVDSDAIYALYNPNDPLNKQSTHTFKELINQGFQLIYPTSVLFEVISLFQRVLPTPTVSAQIIDLIKSDRLPIQVVDSGILKAAAEIFNPAGSKKNTLIDCSVVAIAKEIKADGVFAYDDFYGKQGLKSAEQLI